MESKIIQLPSVAAAVALAGSRSINLQTIGKITNAQIVLRGQELWLEGAPEAVDQAVRLIYGLETLWSKGLSIMEVDILAVQQSLATDRLGEWQQRPQITKSRQGQVIQARTPRQQEYVRMIETHDLTFAIGPAGTGKTFLAAVVAVKLLQENAFDRLILTRPAVEAGERLGYLPGDLQQKISPYLRPLYDALYELIDADRIPQLMEKGTIEIAPLAYMRGRTLNRSFIIVDEAQNTTPAQMKMVLTRLGMYSRMVVTGDISQTDLPSHQPSGLVMAGKLLRSVEGIGFMEFTRADVVRHPLVQRIIAAYDRAETSS